MKKCFMLAALAALPVLSAVEKDSPMLKDFLETAANFAAEQPEELTKMAILKWESRREYRIVFSNKEFYSFKAVDASYSGGAHGMTQTVVGTFYKGKRLKLADLGRKRELEKLWQQAIAKHFKAESFEKYVKSNRFFKPFMTENFYLDDKAIHFIYNPIEIDCYAAGTIDIFVPWKFSGK